MRKPKWIRAQSPVSAQVMRLKRILRDQKLHTVCEEASCPNLGECFGHNTATFLIMGNICTRRCPFCDVAHGRPDPLDCNEPENLARTVKSMELNYVVVTSVNRDDLRDGGAGHYVACIKAMRKYSPGTRIEILVPDFRGRMEVALDMLSKALPDVFNHNLETVPRLYRQVRPGADYRWSLQLIKRFKEQYSEVPTKSGVMLGLGESTEEIGRVLVDLRDHFCDMLTIGQYLQPGKHHLPVARYVVPAEFDRLAQLATGMGFRNVISGPMVRSSYHAEQQAAAVVIGKGCR